MLRVVAIIAACLLLVVAGVLVFATTRPDSFRVERSITINAPAEKVYPLISNLKSWTSWSPYEKKDPDMKRSFSGPAEGVGAVYEWDGNGNVGQGRMEITQATAPTDVVIQLDFLRPMEAHNTAAFTLEPAGDSTTVTWAIYGPCPYISKLMGVFFDLDKMIGADFEAGLVDLKAATEG
jgi:hypothetical protein